MRKVALLAALLPFVLASAVPIAPRPSPHESIDAAYYEQFSPGTLIFHGSRSGLETLDGGTGAGNPFATAFIDALGAGALSVSGFTEHLRAGTRAKSYGFQNVDTNAALSDADRPILRDGERRRALVLIVSDYSPSGDLASLVGARFDAMRVSAALEEAGFEVTLSLNNSIGFTRGLLSLFAEQSQEADVSLIYTTGHGVEYSGVVRLVMGDYSVESGQSGLEEAASLPLPEIAAAARARALNLVFYAGCRNNAFGF